MPKCSVLSQLWFLNRTSKLVSLEIMLYCIQYDICTNHCLGFQNDYKTIFKKFLIWEFTIKYAVMRMIKSWLGKMGWVPMRSPAREWLGGTAAGSGGAGLRRSPRDRDVRVDAAGRRQRTGHCQRLWQGLAGHGHVSLVPQLADPARVGGSLSALCWC